jgi:hypothetical protein
MRGCARSLRARGGRGSARRRRSQRGDPKQDPARPGRKSGAQYGTRARRRIPERVDEVIRVALPQACGCGCGELDVEGEVDQYQEEIVEILTHVRR